MEILVLYVAAVSGLINLLEKVNFTHLSKGAIEKDWSLKTQLLFSNSSSDEKEPGDHVWCHQGIFGNEKGKLNISKVYFPENTLIYANQSPLTTVKGDNVVHLQYFVMGQIMSVLNSLPDSDN